MANPWGPKLSEAIRQRAYSSGALARKLKKIKSLETALEVTRRDAQAIKDCLNDLDQRIEAMSAIDVGAIRPINRVPKSGLFKHGELAATIVIVLKESSDPLATPAIVTIVAKKLGLPLDSGKDWSETRARVKKQLQTYARKGAVERLHDLETNDIGTWRWVGL